MGYYQTGIIETVEMASPEDLVNQFEQEQISKYSSAISELADPKLDALRTVVPLHQQIFGEDNGFAERTTDKVIDTLSGLGMLSVKTVNSLDIGDADGALMGFNLSELDELMKKRQEEKLEESLF